MEKKWTRKHSFQFSKSKWISWVILTVFWILFDLIRCDCRVDIFNIKLNYFILSLYSQKRNHSHWSFHKQGRINRLKILRVQRSLKWIFRMKYTDRQQVKYIDCFSNCEKNLLSLRSDDFNIKDVSPKIINIKNRSR